MVLKKQTGRTGLFLISLMIFLFFLFDEGKQ